MISRRKFLARALGLAGGWILFRADLSFGSLYPHFFFTQIQYRGGEWDPNPMYAGPIVEELELRTSIDATRERRIIEVSDPALFYSPFLYMAGRYEFEPFTETERAILKRFLTWPFAGRSRKSSRSIHWSGYHRTTPFFRAFILSALSRGVRRSTPIWKALPSKTGRRLSIPRMTFQGHGQKTNTANGSMSACPEGISSARPHLRSGSISLFTP